MQGTNIWKGLFPETQLLLFPDMSAPSFGTGEEASLKTMKTCKVGNSTEIRNADASVRPQAVRGRKEPNGGQHTAHSQSIQEKPYSTLGTEQHRAR